MPKPLQEDRPIWPPMPAAGETPSALPAVPDPRESDSDRAAEHRPDRPAAISSFEGFGSFAGLPAETRRPYPGRVRDLRVTDTAPSLCGAAFPPANREAPSPERALPTAGSHRLSPGQRVANLMLIAALATRPGLFSAFRYCR